MRELTNFLEELRVSAWRTECARYNAVRRLKRRDWFGTLSIGGFSAIGIGIAFIQKGYATASGTPVDNYLTALSICLGLFVIVTSLIEWGSGLAVKAELLFQNAQKLNTFQRKLGQRLAEVADKTITSSEEVTKLREEYEQIKNECPYNHEPIDDQLFLAQRRFDSNYEKIFRRKKPNCLDAFWAALLSFFNSVWYFGFFWLVIYILLISTPW